MTILKKVSFDFNFDDEEEKAIKKIEDLLNEICISEFSNCAKCLFNSFCNDNTISIKGMLKGMTDSDIAEVE